MNKNQYSLTEKPKILIVDDKPENIFALEDVLSELDVEMVKETNGNDALKATLNQRFALAILDVQMPKMDGYELAELMRIKKETSHIPIIFLSAVYSDKLHIFKGYKAGAIDFLTKPYNPEILIGKVKIFLEQYKYKNKLEILVNELNETNKKLQFETTEREKADVQIRKLSHAIEQSSSMVIITDTDGNIEYVNPVFAQSTGYSIGETIGKNPRFLKSDETSSEVYEELWKAITSGNEWRGEFCNKKKNGELYWESASISPVKNDKSIITNFIAIKDDITERKQMEEALLQSEKLKSLGIITAGISHEFNNILAITRGCAEMLEIGFGDVKELKKGLHSIMKASDDGAEIVRNMLTFAKSEASQTEYIFFDIRDLIKQAIDFTMPRWKNMAQAKGIDYQIDKEGMRETPEVFCNPTELREVLTNIINNALDAMPDGGSLSFSTWSNEDTVFIRISDSGKGMPEEVKKKIFDPFFTTRRPLGTGLGMSVSYGVIMRHGGRIEVESEEGKGATFNLSLPIKKEIAQQKPSFRTETQEIKANGLRVLVVDDSEELCVITNNFLTREGHIVKTVNDGEEAIELAGKEDFDLVLCDLAMPNVYGYEVIKAINKLGKMTKIGIITGWDEKIKPTDDEDYKVDFILKKPFNFSELEKHINEVCEKGSTDTEAS